MRDIFPPRPAQRALHFGAALIILVSGAASSGKSTLAWQLLTKRRAERIAYLQCKRAHGVLESLKELSHGDFDFIILELLPFDDPDLAREQLAGAGLARQRIRIVTVVNAGTMLADFCSQDLISDRRAGTFDDSRSVADVLTEQIESADILALNKTDQVDDLTRSGIIALLAALAPDVPRLECQYGFVPRECILDTSSNEGSVRPATGSVARALSGQPFPDAERLDITTLVFRERTPFHPARLQRFFGESWEGVVRAGGFFWIASRPDWVGELSQAGAARRYRAISNWWAATLEGQDIEKAQIEELLGIEWDPIHGDRRQELAFVGLHFDPEALRSRLEECLLTRRELQLGRESWQAFEDPFPPWGLSTFTHRRSMYH